MDKKWIRQEKAHVASEGERYRVLGELGMHPGYSEGGLKAPKGPLSIFTEPESAKVFGIGYTTNPVDHAAMKVTVRSRISLFLYTHIHTHIDTYINTY